MKEKLIYHIFYWHPNTISEERVAIGLCLFDVQKKWLDSHWIARKELGRLQKIFSFSSSRDAAFILQLLADVKVNWKEIVFKTNFWEYANRYWNGLVQVSLKKTMLYDGSREGFQNSSLLLQEKFLPLAKSTEREPLIRSRGIHKIYKREVEKVRLGGKVALRHVFRPDNRYHLLKPIEVDLAARNGEPIVSTGFDMSLKQETLTEKALAYFDGFKKIRKLERGEFSIVLHDQGLSFNPETAGGHGFYDNFIYTCNDLDINVMDVQDLSGYLEKLAGVDGLRPLEH